MATTWVSTIRPREVVAHWCRAARLRAPWSCSYRCWRPCWCCVIVSDARGPSSTSRAEAGLSHLLAQHRSMHGQQEASRSVPGFVIVLLAGKFARFDPHARDRQLQPPGHLEELAGRVGLRVPEQDL